LAAAINRSQAWVNSAERGRVPLSTETENHILHAIALLAALTKAQEGQKARFAIAQGLHLPDVPQRQARVNLPVT